MPVIVQLKVMVMMCLCLCSMLALPQPSSKSLQHIYQVVLGRFFQEGEYMPEVKDSLYALIAAAIAIYYRMCANMRPTPAKIHYTFNIRDLSKVASPFQHRLHVQHL